MSDRAQDDPAWWRSVEASVRALRDRDDEASTATLGVLVGYVQDGTITARELERALGRCASKPAGVRVLARWGRLRMLHAFAHHVPSTNGWPT